MAKLLNTKIGNGDTSCNIIFPVKPEGATLTDTNGRYIVTDFNGFSTTTSYQPQYSSLFLGTAWYPPAHPGTSISSDRYYTGINMSSSGGGSPVLYVKPSCFQGDIATSQLEGNLTSFLGYTDIPWTYLYLGQYNYSSGSSGGYYCYSYLRGTNTGIQIYLSEQSTPSAIYPTSNSTSTSTGYNLGNSLFKWRYLYAYSGTIQTSDRAAKDSIHYLEEQPVVAKMSAKSTTTSTTGITVDDVIDFVKNIKPTTFCYYDGKETATEENSDPEMIQLGLIADDIKTHPVFKYVGVQSTAKELDDDGNEIEGSEHEVLGLQPLPLAVASLTACKDLIGRVEELESKMELLESRLAALENA